MENEGYTAVVLHVDLDCFYAAVEHMRLGIPKEQPLAVQQRDGLIAVNYAARAAGIVRHERVSEALLKCPDLYLVHVETIGSSEGGSAAVGPRSYAKVCLERYRQASASVFTIFRRFSDVFERASIDEAYLDVTDQVEDMMEKGYDWEGELQRLLHGEGDTSNTAPQMLVEAGPLVPFNAYDRRLLAGAIIAERVRSAVRNELGYTCSVGIATNKLLAKIASAKNKPDRQTLIPPRAVSGLMETLPLKKIKLLGGKLGEEMKQKWGCLTAGEAQQVPLAALVACLGERLGNYAWRAVRGLQADKVQLKQISKSMLAATSFSATKDLSEVRRWLGVLANELSVRMHRDFEQNHRQPRLLQLYYRSGEFKHSSDHSKSIAMPPTALQLLLSSSHSPTKFHKSGLGQSREIHMIAHVEDDDEVTEGNQEENENEGRVRDGKERCGAIGPPMESVAAAVTEKTLALAKVLEDIAFRMFERLSGALPCTRLALAASGFQELPGQGVQSIEHFFSSSGGQLESVNVDTGLQRIHPIPKPVERCAGRPQGILKYLTSYPTTSTEQDTNSRKAHSSCRGRSIEEGLVATGLRCQVEAKTLTSGARVDSCSTDQETVSCAPHIRMPADLEGEGLPSVDFSSLPILGLESGCKNHSNQPIRQSEMSDMVRTQMDPRHFDKEAIVEDRIDKTNLDSAVASPSVQDEREASPKVKNGEEVDLKTVNVDEQCRILEAIYQSNGCPPSGPSGFNLQKQGKSREPSVMSNKRLRHSSGHSQPGQRSISNFFHAQNNAREAEDSGLQ